MTAERIGLNTTEFRTVTTPYPVKTEAHDSQAATTPLSSSEASRYRSAVGALLWITSMTRHDIAFAVSQLARHVSHPTTQHMKLMKHTMRYLLSTPDTNLTFAAQNQSALVHDAPDTLPFTLTAASDATWGIELDGTFHIGWIVGINGTPIINKSKRWRTAALSSTESEIIALSEAARDVLSLRWILAELGYPQNSPTTIRCDSTGAISNSIDTTRRSDAAKHIRIRDFFIRDCITRGELFAKYVHTTDHVVDTNTKQLPPIRIVRHRPVLQGMTTRV